MIASARMYSWSPSAATAWHRLLGWVAKTAAVDLTLLDQSDPTSLDELWQRDDMGCVFMCGYPWALRRDRPALLASPVPSAPRYGGRAIYVTDFIVRAGGPHTTLADTFGGSIAYSTEHSHSAYNAPRYHLLAHVTPERRALYRTVLGPYVRQRPIIDAVISCRAALLGLPGKAAPTDRALVVTASLPITTPAAAASRAPTPRRQCAWCRDGTAVRLA